MKVIVNGTQHDFSDNTTIADLIAQLELKDRKIAIEMNLEVVPSARHNSTLLAEGDRIEIIEAVGGG